MEMTPEQERRNLVLGWLLFAATIVVALLYLALD